MAIGINCLSQKMLPKKKNPKDVNHKYLLYYYYNVLLLLTNF